MSDGAKDAFAADRLDKRFVVAGIKNAGKKGIIAFVHLDIFCFGHPLDGVSTQIKPHIRHVHVVSEDQIIGIGYFPDRAKEVYRRYPAAGLLHKEEINHGLRRAVKNDEE